MPYDSPQMRYRNSTRSTASPRTVERRLLEEFASKLEQINPYKDEKFAQFAEVLHENLRLWLVFGTEAARSDNPMDQSLRANIVSLADFIRQHTAKVIGGQANADVLIEINRNIAAGMRGISPDHETLIAMQNSTPMHVRDHVNKVDRNSAVAS